MVFSFSNQDHEIESSLEEFKQDILILKLKITEIFIIWGQIWAVCENDE